MASEDDDICLILGSPDGVSVFDFIRIGCPVFVTVSGDFRGDDAAQRDGPIYARPSPAQLRLSVKYKQQTDSAEDTPNY